MTVVGYGLPGVLLMLIVAALPATHLGRRVIVRRREARCVDRLMQGFIDSGRLMREFTEPVTPGQGTNPSTGPSVIRGVNGDHRIADR